MDSETKVKSIDKAYFILGPSPIILNKDDLITCTYVLGWGFKEEANVYKEQDRSVGAVTLKEW